MPYPVRPLKDFRQRFFWGFDDRKDILMENPDGTYSLEYGARRIDENSILIGTWNVEYAYPSRLERIQSFLNTRYADIWVLTETHDDLKPLTCPYAVHARQRVKNWSGIRDGSRWVSIWSRFPVLEDVRIEVSDPFRTVCAAFSVNNSRTLIVYGTVLPWHTDRGAFPKENPPPNWSEHHRVIPEQGREWAAIRTRYPDAALCVAGDFNSDMVDGRRYGTMQGVAQLAKGLGDAGLYCATEPSRLLNHNLPVLPIDHIAVPLGWRTSIEYAWGVDRALSDHSGLVIKAEPPIADPRQTAPIASKGSVRNTD